MQEVFMEWLDQIYWEGYAAVLQDNDPVSYSEQLTAFKNLYQSF